MTTARVTTSARTGMEDFRNVIVEMKAERESRIGGLTLELIEIERHICKVCSCVCLGEKEREGERERERERVRDRLRKRK